MLQVKTCFDCKMFDVTNWVVGHRLLLVRDHVTSPRLAQNPVNVMKGADLHPKTTLSKSEGWVSTKGLWLDTKKGYTYM